MPPRRRDHRVWRPHEPQEVPDHPCVAITPGGCDLVERLLRRVVIDSRDQEELLQVRVRPGRLPTGSTDEGDQPTHDDCRDQRSVDDSDGSATRATPLGRRIVPPEGFGVPGMSGPSPSRRACVSHSRGLIQHGDIGKVTELLGVVKTIPHDEPILDREPHVLDANLDRPPRSLVQQ